MGNSHRDYRHVTLGVLLVVCFTRLLSFPSFPLSLSPLLVSITRLHVLPLLLALFACLLSFLPLLYSLSCFICCSPPTRFLTLVPFFCSSPFSSFLSLAHVECWRTVSWRFAGCACFLQLTSSSSSCRLPEAVFGRQVMVRVRVPRFCRVTVWLVWYRVLIRTVQFCSRLPFLTTCPLLLPLAFRPSPFTPHPSPHTQQPHFSPLCPCPLVPPYPLCALRSKLKKV